MTLKFWSQTTTFFVWKRDYKKCTSNVFERKSCIQNWVFHVCSKLSCHVCWKRVGKTLRCTCAYFASLHDISIGCFLWYGDPNQWVLVYFPSSAGSLGDLPVWIHIHIQTASHRAPRTLISPSMAWFESLLAGWQSSQVLETAIRRTIACVHHVSPYFHAGVPFCPIRSCESGWNCRFTCWSSLDSLCNSMQFYLRTVTILLSHALDPVCVHKWGAEKRTREAKLLCNVLKRRCLPSEHGSRFGPSSTLAWRWASWKFNWQNTLCRFNKPKPRNAFEERYETLHSAVAEVKDVQFLAKSRPADQLDSKI